MSKKYKVVVYAKRNDQPTYTYAVHTVVKQSKLSQCIIDALYDIWSHETRSGLSGQWWAYRTGGVVLVGGGLRFIVKGWPL